MYNNPLFNLSLPSHPALSKKCNKKKIKLTFATDGSSRLEEFCKKGVLKKLANVKQEHLCQSLVFNKVAGLCRPVNLVKK